MYFKEKIKFSLLLILTYLSVECYGQGITDSPYSRYGLGDLYSSGFGHNIAMGGTAIGESTPLYINPINPAGNTSLLLQRFVFDVGLDAKFTTTSTESVSQKNTNTTFKYLAGGFAAKEWLYFNFMLKPYSAVGYQVTDSAFASLASDGSSYGYKETYSGSGGINQFAIGTAVKFYGVSLGVNAYYLFGSLNRNHTIYSTASDAYSAGIWYKNKYYINGFKFDFGAMYSKEFKQKKDSLRNALKINIGVVYGNKTDLNSRNELFLYKYNTLTATTDTIVNDTLSKQDISMPQNLGIGVSFEIMDKFTINADYRIQDWTSFSLPGEDNTDLLKSTYKGVGFQYTADKYSSRYYKTISYRCGFHQEDSYISINGHTVKDQGFSVGLGFPLRTLLLNVSCDFGKRGTTDFNMIEEKYFLLHFNVSMHDAWFVKRKFN